MSGVYIIFRNVRTGSYRHVVADAECLSYQRKGIYTESSQRAQDEVIVRICVEELLESSLQGLR